MYNKIDPNNVDQKQTTHNSLYTLANNKLHLSSDLEDLHSNNTNSRQGKLIIAYNNKIGNKALCPRTFYALYAKPNKEPNEHLIYRLDTNQLVVTKDYRTVPVPEDLDDTICETEPYENKVSNQ